MEIGADAAGTPAEKAVLQAGDKIISTDQTEFAQWEEWTQYIQRHPNKTVDLVVERKGALKEMAVIPQAYVENGGRTLGRVGVYAAQAPWPESMLITRKLGIVPAFHEGVKQTWSNSLMVFLSIKKLVLGQISIKNLSGPIGIAKVAGDSARAGLQYYFNFMAVLSVYLGVFNLLPIPILDGGRVVFCVAEGLRGKPLSERVKLFGLQMGLTMMAFMMVMAFYNDILRLF